MAARFPSFCSTFLLTHPVWDVTYEIYWYRNDWLYFYSHIPCGMWHCIWIIFIQHSIQFLLTHPVWDVTTHRIDSFQLDKFLLTHPVWDVTEFPLTFPASILNFYSHIPCGMWHYPSHLQFQFFLFLLTHPVWDVTVYALTLLRLLTISTHTSRVGCDIVPIWQPPNLKISTHTSRVGCDYIGLLNGFMFYNFYSHIPCGMWRFRVSIPPPHLLFLLTHPVWDVTHSALQNYALYLYFYSHIPCGMWRRNQCFNWNKYRNFYSHIPCGMWRGSVR